MRTTTKFFTFLLAFCCLTCLYSQSNQNKKKQEELILPGKQKIRQVAFDSVWKFTDFNAKKQYFVNFDYNSFSSMPKKVKYWGAMEPLVNFMLSNPRQSFNVCAIFAINPSIEEASRKLQLSEQERVNAKKAIQSYADYLKENDYTNKIAFQVAEVDYRYWLGSEYFEKNPSKEEIIPLGLLVSFGGKKPTFFPKADTTKLKPFKNIKFFPNNTDLIESYKSIINELADYLKSDEQLEVVLYSYSDNSGTETYNLKLSEKRAQTIKDELVKQNIAPYRIEIISLGSSNPIGDNDTHEGKVANNRVEIKIR